MRTRSSQHSEEMQGGNNLSHLENVLANLTTLIAQQAANTAAREEAEAQRAAAAAALAAQNQAEENARRAQQEERERIAAQTRGLNDFKRQEPPKFSGGFDPEEADSWLQELEKIFTFLHTPAEKKVDYATYLLTGEAEYWWRGARAMMEGNQQPVTWESFRKAFLASIFRQVLEPQERFNS